MEVVANQTKLVLLNENEVPNSNENHSKNSRRNNREKKHRKHRKKEGNRNEGERKNWSEDPNYHDEDADEEKRYDLNGKLVTVFNYQTVKNTPTHRRNIEGHGLSKWQFTFWV